VYNCAVADTPTESTVARVLAVAGSVASAAWAWVRTPEGSARRAAWWRRRSRRLLRRAARAESRGRQRRADRLRRKAAAAWDRARAIEDGMPR